MGEYGYAYRSISTYSTTRNGGTRELLAAVKKKPLFPNNYSEDAVTRKKIVPVVSRSYDEPAATGKYPSSGSEDESDDDDDRHRRQTNPVHSSPRKVQNHEGSHNPQRLGPVVDRGRHTPQLTAEGHRPTGGSSTINHDGANYVGNKGHKLIGIDPIGNHNYDGDRRAPIVVGDPKEGRKSIGISPNNYDGSNGNGGERRVVRDPKEGYKPIGISPIRSGNYDGTNGYGGDRRAIGDPKEGYKTKPIGISPIKSGNYDSNNGYGGDHRAPAVGDPSKGYKSIGISPIRSDNYGGTNHYDGYNNGYGGHNIVNYNNRSNPNGPKISSNWSAAPRQGTQLSEPINDIDKAMELLKMEAAKRDHQRSISNNTQYYDGSINASPTGRPYGGNFIQSQPRMSPTPVTYIPDDDDDDDYNYYTMDNTGRYGGHHNSIIDSREAEKRFKGTRV